MHKHFRMIAISEHLRNHGFDPDFLPHTRIPGIWAKLRTYYNMEAIDERENNIDDVDDEDFERRYLEFSLPWEDFGEEIMSRARADPSEAPTTPPQWDTGEEQPSVKKRKRGADTPTRSSAGPKARDSTVEDTEGETPARSPAPRTARGARSSKRAASKARRAKEESVETGATAEDEEEEGEEENEKDEEEDSGDADEESDEEEAGTPASRSTRGNPRGRGRTRARGTRRGRGRGG